MMKMKIRNRKEMMNSSLILMITIIMKIQNKPFYKEESNLLISMMKTTIMSLMMRTVRVMILSVMPALIRIII